MFHDPRRSGVPFTVNADTTQGARRILLIPGQAVMVRPRSLTDHLVVSLQSINVRCPGCGEVSRTAGAMVRFAGDMSVERCNR